MPSAVTNKWMTLLDIKNLTTNGLFHNTVDVISKPSVLLGQMPMIPANKGFEYHGSRMTALATAGFIGIDQGSTSTKGTWIPVVEPVKLCNSMSDVPKRVADSAKQPQEFRAIKDAANSLGLRSTVTQKLLYGSNGSDADEFDGMATRMATLATHNATTGPYIVNNEGSNNVTSIYAVKWSPNYVFGIYPENHGTMGLEIADKGSVFVADSGGTEQLEVYRTMFDQYVGLAVESYRGLGRLCNIETSSTGTTVNDDLLLELISYFDDLDGLTLYANRTVFFQLAKLAKDKSNVTYTPDMAFGVPIVRIMGVPIFKCDEITGSYGTYETAVS